jgi:archaellum biogenesis ATPase FlaH
MKKKRVTDKNLMYLFNALILSKIEYCAQTTVFSEKENDNLMKPFRKMFKNKLSFATSAPNSIVENSLIYKIRSFNDNQLQLKITNF